MKTIDPINFIKKHWSAISIMILCGITILSLAPLKQLPDAPGTDKTHHLMAYAALAYPASLRRPTGWKAIILMFLLYGGLIEIIQPYTNRYGEWFDFAANATGLFLGCVLALSTIKLQVKLNRSQDSSNNVVQEKQ